MDISTSGIVRCNGCGDGYPTQDLAYFGPEDESDESCTPFSEFVAYCEACYEIRR